MKKILAALTIAAIVLSVCSCGADTPNNVTEPATEKQTEITLTPETEEVTEKATEAPDTDAPDTEPPPVTETGRYSFIDTVIVSNDGSSGTLALYSNGTYTFVCEIISSELGVESKTVTTENGTFVTSDGDRIVCSGTDINVKITFKNDGDKKEALDTLEFLCGIEAVTGDYFESYKTACGDGGYSASSEGAKNDPLLSEFVSDAETKVLLDKEKGIGYDVTVVYDLPDGQYFIESEDCILTLGKDGECSLKYVLTGDDGNDLGTYESITLLTGKYERSGSFVTCTITGELTRMKYESSESQDKYIKSVEESYESGKIIKDVYDYLMAVASEEGRYLDYGDSQDEYGLFVIEATHAAVFKYTPSQEYIE